MTIKMRRWLFYAFLVLFIFVSVGVVSYSRGWRINISDYKIKFQKTGAIFIETRPKGAVIKINGETFKDKSGLTQRGTLISNLLPKTYEVKIEKEGYQPYRKNIKVEPDFVAEIVQTVLVPGEFKKTLISIPKPADDFWISSGKIVFKNNNVLYYLKNSSLFKLRGDKLIAWSEDGGKIILLDSKNKVHYLYELANLNKTLNINAILSNLSKKADIRQIAFHPADSSRLIVQSENSLYILDLNRLQLETLIQEPISFWTIKNPNIYYFIQASGNYSLNSFNLILKTKTAIAQLLNYQIAKLPNSLISPDNEKIAFLDNNGKLNIYFLEDYQRDIDLNFYEGLIVKNIFWYKDSSHLFIEYSDANSRETASIDFIEIDNRPPINRYTVFEKISNFYYEPSLDRLYFIQSSDKLRNLYFIEL